jgi:hypothetical protein
MHAFRSWDYGGALIMDGMYESASYFGFGDEWHTQLDAYLDGWTKDKTSDGYAMARNQTQPFGTQGRMRVSTAAMQPQMCSSRCSCRRGVCMSLSVACYMRWSLCALD